MPSYLVSFLFIKTAGIMKYEDSDIVTIRRDKVPPVIFCVKPLQSTHEHECSSKGGHDKDNYELL